MIKKSKRKSNKRKEEADADRHLDYGEIEDLEEPTGHEANEHEEAEDPDNFIDEDKSKYRSRKHHIVKELERHNHKVHDHESGRHVIEEDAAASEDQ